MTKINILEAISEYEDEQARLAELMAETTKTVVVKPVDTEKDPLWDCWFESAFIYEPHCDKDVEEAEDAEDDVEPVRISYKKDRAKHAMRRKATAMHKRKDRRTIAIIWQNYCEREGEDMRNWSYKKLKNGDRINNPKSQSAKADRIFKRALKVGTVPEDLHDDIAKHVKWTSEYCKRNIGGTLEVDRYYREREEAVKLELEEMQKANLNVFNMSYSDRVCWKLNNAA